MSPEGPGATITNVITRSEKRREQRSLFEVLRATRRTGRIAVMADVKFRSPRDGDLISPDRLDDYVAALVDGEVDALSTPTESRHFGGRIDLAARIRGLTDLPLMRKEFFSTVDQMDESARVGFDAVQLSVNTVPPGRIERMRDRARSLGLEVVLGVHDENQLRRALELGPAIIAVNNRDIVALELDDGTVRRTTSLIAGIPPELPVISESSFRTPDEVAQAGTAGAEAVLVGTALAQSDDPTALVREMRAKARTCRR